MKGKNMRILAGSLAVILTLSGTVASAPVTAQAAAPKLSAKKATLYVGQSKKLNVKNTKKKIKWSSSNKKVATVSKKGVVKAVKAGKATITAKVGKKKLKCQVTVKKLRLNKTKATLYVGGKLKLSVIKTSGKITWTSSNKKVAVINAKGLVTAKKAGKAKLTAKIGKTKLTCTLTVKKRPQKKPTSTKQDNTTTKPSQTQTTPAKPSKPALKLGNPGIRTRKNGTKTEEYMVSEELTCKVYGTATQGSSKLSSLSWTLTGPDGKNIGKGTTAAKTSWSIVLDPAIGWNTLTITLTDSAGNKVSKTLLIEQKGTVLADNALPLDAKQTEELVTAVEDLKVSEESASYGTRRLYDLTVKADSAFGRRIKNAEIGDQKTVIVPPNDTWPAGLTFTIDTITQKDDQYVIHGKEPEFSELFAGDGEMNYTGGADAENPIAFVSDTDGTTYTGKDLQNLLSGTSGSAKNANTQTVNGIDTNGQNPPALAAGSDDTADTGTYSRSVFPEGVKIQPKVSTSVDGTFTIDVSFDNVVLYDADKKKDTQEDRILADAKLTYSDITVEGRTAWEGWAPDQISFGMSYNSTEDIKLKLKKSVKLSDVMKAASKFENKTKFPGGEYTGVDVDGKIFLGVIGIRGGKPFIGKGIDKAISYDPIFFISLYLHLDGSISSEGSFGMNYKAYKEEGFSFYDTKSKNVVNKHAFDEVKTYDGTNFASGTWSKESVSKTDSSAPQWRTELSFPNATVKGNIGIGLMGGVSVMNIIPGDVYGEFGASLEGKVQGSIYGLTKAAALKEAFDAKGKLAVDVKYGWTVGADFALSLKIAAKFLNNFNIGISASVKKDFMDDLIHVEFPGAILSGKIMDCEQERDGSHEGRQGAELYLYKKDKRFDGKEVSDLKAADLLKLNHKVKQVIGYKDGTYEIPFLPTGKYILLTQFPGYHDKIQEVEIKKDKDGFAENLTQDIYIYEYNWLDELTPSSLSNSDSTGTAKVYDGSDPNKAMIISGVLYGAALSMNNGNQGTGGTCEAVWNLGGKYESLDVRVGHEDSTSLLSGTRKIRKDSS